MSDLLLSLSASVRMCTSLIAHLTGLLQHAQRSPRSSVASTWELECLMGESQEGRPLRDSRILRGVLMADSTSCGSCDAAEHGLQVSSILGALVTSPS